MLNLALAKRRSLLIFLDGEAIPMIHFDQTNRKEIFQGSACSLNHIQKHFPVYTYFMLTYWRSVQ